MMSYLKKTQLIMHNVPDFGNTDYIKTRNLNKELITEDAILPVSPEKLFMKNDGYIYVMKSVIFQVNSLFIFPQ